MFWRSGAGEMVVHREVSLDPFANSAALSPLRAILILVLRQMSDR